MNTGQARQETRFVRIADGVVAQVVERRSILPATLDALLRALTVRRRLAVFVSGTNAASCRAMDHRLLLWIEAGYLGRALRLSMCRDCGVVEVRDVSLDMLPLAHAPILAPRRRDHVLGWYSGKRASGRIHL